MFTTLFDLISLLYALAALYTLRDLWLHRREFGDGVFTPAERRLGEMVGFLFLTPVGVLAHEGAHWAVARALGAADAAISFRLYWGYVTYSARLSNDDAWLVAAAGPLASLLLGLAALLAALGAGGFARAVLASFAQATLMLVLVAYPAMSFLGLFGDFVVIYLFGGPWRAAGAAAVHAAALVLVLRLLRRFEWWSPPAAAEPAPGQPPDPPTEQPPGPAATSTAPAAAAAGSAPAAAAEPISSDRPAAPAADPRRRWLAWTIASALGLVVGKLLAPTGVFVGVLLLFVIASATDADTSDAWPPGAVPFGGYGAVVGASIGWAQYVLLQRWFASPERWIGLSLLGGAVGGAAAGLLGAALDPLIALGVGLGQALALSRGPRTLLLPPLSAATYGGAALALAGSGGPASEMQPDGPALLRWLLAGVLYGAATGALLFLRRRPTQ